MTFLDDACRLFGVLRHPAFDNALDAGDRSALRPYSDWLRERGDDAGADALAWAADAGRWPHRGGWGSVAEGDYSTDPCEIPAPLWEATYRAAAALAGPGLPPHPGLFVPAAALLRLRVAWANTEGRPA